MDSIRVRLTKINKLFLLIIFIAAALRIIGIGQNPPSLTWDEVAWGYNAYSIGLDGKDEFGKLFPITFLESFGDFKPPLYAYLSIIPIKIFGLTEFGTRFASAFFGILTVIVTYFLVKEIFKAKDFDEKKKEMLALITSGILAISPWHFMLSRAAFEANVASFFLIFGVYAFLRSRTIKWFVLFSFLSFIASMYTFNTARIVAPILIVGLILGNIRHLLKIKKEFFISIIISGFIFLPLLLFLMTPQAKLRFAEVNIFTEIEVVKRTNQEILNDNNNIFSKVIHNRRFAYGVEFLKHYFDNLDPAFLFIRGDGNPKFSIQDVGELYIWEAPFIIFGALWLFRKRVGFWWFIPFWLIVGIIPAATARETPHALRIEATLPTFQILTAFGIFSFFELLLTRKRIFYTSLSILSVILSFSFLYFIHSYVVHYPVSYSSEWQYGYKDLVGFLRQNKGNYEKIYMTEALGRPYVYFLFYEQYDPKKFRENAHVEREALGFVHVKSFDKYYFSKTFDNIPTNDKTLFIDVPEKVPGGAKVVNKFNLLNGDDALVAYTQ